MARMGGALSREDAEDIVSESLLRAHRKLATRPPEPGKEDAWFGRLVLNQGIDFIRARDGRSRNGSGSVRTIVPLSAFDADVTELVPRLPETDGLEPLAAEAERGQARELVDRVMTALDPQDVELIKLRHLVADRASREELARMAGLTVGEFRWRYSRAWNRFVDAVAVDAPTERCARIRKLLGTVESGGATAAEVAEIDSHTLDCASCRVFARESYRALELLPYVPAVACGERWWDRIAGWFDRSNPEVTAGAGTAAAGAGIWSTLAGSGSAGLVKFVAIVCSATAATAGVCAGVATLVRHPPEPKEKTTRRAERPAPPRRRTPTPTPVVVRRATPTPTPRPRRQTVARRNERPARTAAVDTSGQSQIPASAPAGATEFNPTSSNAPVAPAPAPASGGGEFTP